MKIKPMLSCLVLLGTSTFAGNLWAASWGPCQTASGQPFEFNATFVKDVQDPTENVTGKTYPDFFQWNLGSNYSAVCECPDNPVTGTPTLYKAESPLPFGHTGGGESYYKINNYLEVATKVSVVNNGYVKAPFINVSNKHTGKECVTPNPGWSTGSLGYLSLYIAHPFVGQIDIPSTRVIEIYGTKMKDNYSAIPLSVVNISGTVTVAQGCELSAGTTLEIPFGEYQAHDFKGRAGQPPVGVQKITKELNLTCSNISDGVKIFVSIEGQANTSFPNAIDLGNADVGAIIEGANGNVLVPNDSSSMEELTAGSLFDYTKRTATTTITAYPVSTTGNLPAAGDYDGVATLHVEVE